MSLGCAKNLVNSEQMMYLVKNAGFHVSGDIENADAVIVNTCAFIESAKTEAIETILELGSLKAEGRIGKIIAAGCMAQRYRGEVIKEMPEVDALVGVGSFDRIVEALEKTLNNCDDKLYFDDINSPVSEASRILTTSPVWAYLKIAEGCDNRCAYCVIPDIRGRYRGRPPDRVVSEAKCLAAQGVKELIVVAQDVTAYAGETHGKHGLPGLLTALSGIDGIEWIRLHYLYPDKISDELIEEIQENDKILNYLDIPIQHINDGILRKMNRRGCGGDIRALFGKLRARIPGLVLRTSLITGLPGEGDKEFEELCEFLSTAKIERVGVFTYSPEEGTAAALMERPDAEVAARRVELLTDLQSRIMDDHNYGRIGSVEKVLVEGVESGVYYGRSYAESPEVDGYITIRGAGIVTGDFSDVRITGVEGNTLTAFGGHQTTTSSRT